MPKLKYGQCPTCLRHTDLTFHHLIPRKVHRRAHFKKHFDKETLNQGVDLCRVCHAGIHKRFNEMKLAKDLNSVERLLAEPELRRFFNWVARQRIRSSKPE